MNHLRLALFLAAAGLLAACERPPPVDANKPRLAAEGNVAFEACPVPRTAGEDPFSPGPNALVVPDEKVIDLRNDGKGPASGITQVLEGAGKDYFKVVELPQTIGAASRSPLAIRFSPDKAGSVSATLKLDDQDESTEPIVINLTGTGRNLPAAPTLKVSVEQVPGGNEFMACDDLFGCSIEAPKTYYGQSTTLRVKVENAGCPPLHITGAEITAQAGVSDNIAFYLDTPAVPPTEAQPLIVNSGSAATGFMMDVRFTPEIDSEGKTNTLRSAVLTLRTNDPEYPEFVVSLFGEAAAPDFSVTPSFCDLSATGNACGATLAGDASVGTFTVRNEGNTPLTLAGSLRNGGVGGRFAIQGLSTSPIGVGETTTFQVRYQDQPLYVRETLTLTATAGGVEAGKQDVGVAGGVLPCLSTNPTNEVSFGNPETTVSTQTVELKNGEGCGRLVLNSITLSQSAEHFALNQDDIDAILQGGPLDAGQTRTFRVTYTRPLIGGSQTAEVRIISNDPNASEQQPHVLLVSSNSPLDTRPEAICYVYDNAGNKRYGFFQAKLSELIPKELVIWADESVDTQPDGSTKPATEFQFRLTSKASSTAVATLENDAKYTPRDNAKLSFGSESSAAQPGEYKVVVFVKDEVGQTSSSPCVMTLNLTQ